MYIYTECHDRIDRQHYTLHRHVESGPVYRVIKLVDVSLRLLRTYFMSGVTEFPRLRTPPSLRSIPCENTRVMDAIAAMGPGMLVRVFHYLQLRQGILNAKSRELYGPFYTFSLN